jgi:Domain of unknown function (DUF4388)
MAFQGSLTELHLPDIIQLISVSGKTGVFHLTDGPLKGQIYLHDGRIVHAQLEDAVGEEAVYTLAIWSQGDFKFEPGTATELRTITKSNTNLLMEAARRLDEWRVLSKKIPSVDMIPEFVVQENREGQINLNTSEWMILSKIDGQRSIKSIAGTGRLSVFDVSKILYGLIATGLIRLREAAPEAAARMVSKPAAPAAPAPVVPAAPSVSPAPAGAVLPPPPFHTGRGPAQTSAAHAAPANSSAGLPSAAAQGDPEAMGRLERVRDLSNSLLGAVGESVVNKHYQKARGDIERGAGLEAVDEAISQIARAASILKGPSTTESLLEQLKSIR